MTIKLLNTLYTSGCHLFRSQNQNSVNHPEKTPLQRKTNDISLKAFVDKGLKWVDGRFKPADNKPVPVNYFPTTLEERRAIAEQVHVGDTIFLELVGKPDEYIEYWIGLMQKVSRTFHLNPSHKFNNTNTNHTATVVGVDKEKGEILISECMPTKGNKVRTIPFFLREARTTEDQAYVYNFFRPTDPAVEVIATKAAEIGKRLGVKHRTVIQPGENYKPPKEISSFSFKKGMYAVLANGFKFKRKEQARAFKYIFEDKAQVVVPKDGRKPRVYFCSKFTTQLYQQAEASLVWDEMVQEKPELKASLDDLIAKTQNLSDKKRSSLVSKWSKKMTKQEGKSLSQRMKYFKFNPSKMGPADFYNHCEKQAVMVKVLTLKSPLCQTS